MRLLSISSEMFTYTISSDEARSITGSVAGDEEGRKEEAVRGTGERGREERGEERGEGKGR